jgi:putative transposase
VLTEHDIPIAPNTYHARKKAPVSNADLEDAYLVNAIVPLWRKNKELYGIRKMCGRCAAPVSGPAATGWAG